MTNLNHSYACNFSATSQDGICYTILIVGNHKWQEFLVLHTENIHSTDIEGKNSPIDVLIGTDAAGNLFAGRKYDSNNI